MSTTALKTKISKAIATIDDEEFLKAVYALVNNKSKDSEYIYSDNLKSELEESSASYQAKKLKTFTLEEVLKKVENNLPK